MKSLEKMCIYIYIGSVTPETGSVELCAIWLYKHVPLKVRGHKFRVYRGIYWQDVSMIASPQNAVSSVQTGDIRHPRHFLKSFTRECAGEKGQISCENRIWKEICTSPWSANFFNIYNLQWMYESPLWAVYRYHIVSKTSPTLIYLISL